MESKRKILTRYRGGEGIRAISRELNISRNTVRNIIREGREIKIGYSRSIQNNPKLGEYMERLEKLLRENKEANRKKTGKKLYEELRAEGYEGSYSAVSRYIRYWLERASEVKIRACVPLTFDAGEAYQFDWSEEYIILEEGMIKVKVAHFILCYSRKRFVYIYPSEKQEMVFDAHVRAFEFFGGTPRRGIYDNMKTAVSKVLRGREREWNQNFERLCAHYVIEPTACTPGRANEKGQVERQVQIDREQFFTPIPKGRSLQELNDILMSRLIIYNSTHKHPEYKEKTIDEVFATERKVLVPAPAMFDGCREVDLKVSVTCLVRYDRNDYSVYCSCAGKIVRCKVYADQIVFIRNGEEVGRHARKFTKGETFYQPEHYVPVLAYKPGALRNGAPFKNMDLPEALKEVRNRLERHPNGSRDFAHILSYIATESLERVASACSQAIEIGTVSKDTILNILFRKKDELSPAEVTKPMIYPSLKHLPAANCSIYNKLLKKARG